MKYNILITAMERRIPIGFQFSGSILDFMVLAILRNGDTYGYVLTQRAKELMDLSDSTLYPILRRLQKEGALLTYDQPFQGRNRRYYSLTGQGQRTLDAYIQDWNHYKERIEQILAEGESRPQEED